MPANVKSTEVIIPYVNEEFSSADMGETESPAGAE